MNNSEALHNTITVPISAHFRICGNALVLPVLLEPVVTQCRAARDALI